MRITDILQNAPHHTMPVVVLAYFVYPDDQSWRSRPQFLDYVPGRFFPGKGAICRLRPILFRMKKDGLIREIVRGIVVLRKSVNNNGND